MSESDHEQVDDDEFVYVGDYVLVNMPFCSGEGVVVQAGEKSVGVALYENGERCGKVVGVMRDQVRLHSEGRPLPDDWDDGQDPSTN